jgi:AcrR family transcriptional regulator
MIDMKENILRVATPRMQQVGIRSVSIEDLCKELGISKKTFYVYFPSKDDLVDAMLHAHEAKITKDVQHLVANKTVVQLLVDWTKIARQTEKSSHQTPPILYDLKKYYPNNFQQHLKRVRRVMQEFMVQFLQKGQTEGIFRQEIDIEVAAMLMVKTHLMLAEYADNHELSPQEIRHIGKTSMDILLRGIFTPGGLLTLEKAVKK